MAGKLGSAGIPPSGRKRKKKTKVIPLRIGTWNVLKLMDVAGSLRPQRRTALVGRELGRYGIQIGALSETLFADVGGDQRRWC